MECLSQIKIAFFIGFIFLSKMHNIINKPVYCLKTHEQCTFFLCVGGSDLVDLILPLEKEYLVIRFYFCNC